MNNVYWIEVLPHGQIYWSSAVPKGITPQPLAGGEMVVVGGRYIPNETAYFDGNLVDIGKPQTEHHKYDYETREWVDQRDLAFYKAEQWALIKKSRDDIEYGPFIYNSMEFDGDLDAQRRLGHYISMAKSAVAAGTPLTVEFTLRNNTEVELSAEDFIAIEQTKIQVVAGAFSKGAMLRGLIEAATSKEQVQAITWDSF